MYQTNLVICSWKPSETLLEVELGAIFSPTVWIWTTPQKTKLDTQNDGLEKVVPFKYRQFWHLC